MWVEKVYEKMKEFAMRVMGGGESIHPQEIAILPEILRMLAEHYKSEN